MSHHHHHHHQPQIHHYQPQQHHHHHQPQHHHHHHHQPQQQHHHHQQKHHHCQDDNLLPSMALLSLPLSKPPAELHRRVSAAPELLSVSWNHNFRCFSTGTKDGVRSFNCDPFSEAEIRFPKGVGGFRIVEIMFQCNYFAVVGDGSNAGFPPDMVFIWDDFHKRFIGEIKLLTPVSAVKLREDSVAVVLRKHTLVYSLPGVKLIRKVVTCDNPNGICALSHDSRSSVMASPAPVIGQVRVERFGTGLKKGMLISAHESQIACLALNADGRLLATASVKGTVIRIFSTVDETCLQKVHRGCAKADIYSITFSPDIQWLTVTSSRYTVHVFKLKSQRLGKDVSQQNSSNEGQGMVHQDSSPSVASITAPNKCSSSLSFMKGVLPSYFSSQQSFAQFFLPAGAHYTAAFGSHNTVAIIGMDGSFYRCKFDPAKGGQMVQEHYVQFLKGSKSRS